MSFWLIFTHCSEAFSLDRFFRNCKPSGPSGVGKVPGAAVRIMQLQLCLLCFVSFYSKATGPSWLDGTAVHLVARLDQFTLFPVPDIFYSVWGSRILTWTTLLVEGLFPVAIWFEETRLWILGAALLLHAGLEYSLNVQLFQYVITSVFILFLKEEELLKPVRWLRLKVSMTFFRFKTISTIEAKHELKRLW